MASVFTRRSLLAGTGCAAAGSIAANLISVAQAAEEQGESAILLSMVYGNDPKAKFDAKRYRAKHLPLLKSIYGDSVERIELRMPPGPGGNAAARASGSNVPSAPPPSFGPPPRVMAAASLWIRDLKAFGERTAANGAQITADLAEVTHATPAVQYDKVLVLLGEGRDAMVDDTQVSSTYFFATENGKFDAKYYAEKVIPLMVSVYGKNAIKRIEQTLQLCEGVKEIGITVNAGGAPHWMAIKNQELFAQQVMPRFKQGALAETAVA